MSPIKVFVIGPRGFPNVQGGIEQFSEGLYPKLVEKGFDITTFAIKRYCSHREWKGVHFINLTTPKCKSLEKPVYNLLAVLHCIVKRPQIVHIHSITSGLFIFLLKIFRLKVVVRFNSRDYLHPKWNSFGKMLLKFSERQFLLADYIITNSKNYREYFREKGREHKLEYIPNGLAPYQSPNPRYCGELLRELSLESCKFVLGVGRITREKNFETLLESFLKAGVSGFKLVIVGEAAHRDDYAGKILRKYRDRDNIIFTGKLNSNTLDCLYQHAALFVIPSLFEGMPNVLLEAMSFRKKILVSGIPAHWDFRFSSDMYFGVNDVETLARKIRWKLKEPGEVNYDLSEFDWDKITGKVATVYNTVLRE